MNIVKFKNELLSSRMWENVKQKYNIIYMAIGGSRGWKLENDYSDIDIILISDNHVSEFNLSQTPDQWVINFPEIFVWTDTETNEKFNMHWKTIQLNKLFDANAYPNDSYFISVTTMPKENILFLREDYQWLPTFFKNNQKNILKNQIYNWKTTFVPLVNKESLKLNDNSVYVDIDYKGALYVIYMVLYYYYSDPVYLEHAKFHKNLKNNVINQKNNLVKLNTNEYKQNIIDLLKIFNKTEFNSVSQIKKDLLNKLEMEESNEHNKR